MVRHNICLILLDIEYREDPLHSVPRFVPSGQIYFQIPLSDFWCLVLARGPNPCGSSSLGHGEVVPITGFNLVYLAD